MAARQRTELLKKDIPFQWTKKCKDALEQLIKAVTSEPMLRQPRQDLQYVLEVDTFQFAIGAVLAQQETHNEGKARKEQQLVGYFSKALTPAK